MTRGIRNNNPGNIEENGTKWQGLSNPNSDGRFCIFDDPKWGIRAIARVIITYQDKYAINTIEGIINRWAPPSENNTSAYIIHVANECDVKPNDIVDVHDYDIAKPLVETIIKHENGSQPYSLSKINEGLRLAGIEPDTASQSDALDQDKPLAKSRTIKGQQVVGAGTAGAALIEVGKQVTDAAQSVQSLVPYLDVAKWVFLGLILVGVGITVYARLDDRKKGRN
jgi:hypothetical protein